MKFADKYRFKIKIPNRSEKVINPINDQLTLKWTRDKDFRFFRWEINEELVIVNELDRNVMTFNELVDVELSSDPCQEVQIKIERKCKGEDDYSEFWTGTLDRVDRAYNVDDCEVSVKPRTKDRYSCLVENWELERDIFEYVNNRVTAKTQIGSIETIECSTTTPASLGFPGPYATNCITGQSGWRLLNHNSTKIGEQVLNLTLYVREVVYGGPEPVGGGWVLEGGKWVRPLPVVLRQILDDSNSGGPNIYEESWKVVSYDIDNGVLLNELLEGLLSVCGFHNYGDEPKLISNFFGIAPDGTQPANDAYTQAQNHLWNLAVWQITDISKHAATSNATKGVLTLKKLLKDLKVMFNVDIYIDSNGVFRIEHFSYFRKEKRLDLTQDLWVKHLKGRGRFSFDKEKLPLKENFNFADKTRYDFDGNPIEYQPSCSDPEREEQYACELFLTDIEYIIQNPERWEESPLFAMAALDTSAGNYYFKFEATPTNTRPLLNGHLSFPLLHENYHQHGRPQEFGWMNLQWRRFQSFKFMKLQPEINVPFGCCDISLFEPEDLVKANFGWSEIEEVEYNLRNEVMTLHLRF